MPFGKPLRKREDGKRKAKIPVNEASLQHENAETPDSNDEKSKRYILFIGKPKIWSASCSLNTVEPLLYG